MTEADSWLIIAQLGGVGALVAAGGFFMIYLRDRERAADVAEQLRPPAE